MPDLVEEMANEGVKLRDAVRCARRVFNLNAAILNNHFLGWILDFPTQLKIFQNTSRKKCIKVDNQHHNLNPNRTGLFLTCFRFGAGGGCRPPIIFVVCGPIAAKFCTAIDNQRISSNMEKNLHKTNDVTDNDVIIVRNLAEKTVKSVYFKVDAASSFFIQSY